MTSMSASTSTSGRSFWSVAEVLVSLTTSFCNIKNHVDIEENMLDVSYLDNKLTECLFAKRKEVGAQLLKSGFIGLGDHLYTKHDKRAEEFELTSRCLQMFLMTQEFYV